MENMNVAFSKQLIACAESDRRIIVVDPEVARSTKMRAFGQAYPDSFVEVGVAEQNAVGISAGLAAGGNVVFCVSFAPFATMRPFEIIRTSAAYPNQNVRIVGAYAGFTDGKDGATHEALEDIANMRSIPRMCVVSPSSAQMSRAIVRAALCHDGPMYIRLENEETPEIYPGDFVFEIGKTCVLRSGEAVTLAAYGTAVHRILAAAEQLEAEGIRSDVLDVASLKPFDDRTLCSSVQKTGRLITLEDHAAVGGLADIAAASLARAGVFARLCALSVPDTFGLSGTQQQLREHFHLNVSDVVSAARALVGKREENAQ